jgi:hypothetical protein
VQPTELQELLTHQPEDWLRRVPGRETFSWSRGPGPATFVVKRMDGNEARDGWYERFRRGGARSPGRREFDNLEALAADGLPVPRARAWFEEGSRSLVVMDLVPHAETLRERAAACCPAELSGWLARLLDIVLGLHGHGWYHRDLYLQHFILPADGPPLVLLDVGRARRESAPRQRWFVKDLAALLHSTPDAVPQAMRLRFLIEYLRARDIRGRRAVRRWARVIERRRARMARHIPRHGEAPA